MKHIVIHTKIRLQYPKLSKVQMMPNIMTSESGPGYTGDVRVFTLTAEPVLQLCWLSPPQKQ